MRPSGEAKQNPRQVDAGIPTLVCIGGGDGAGNCVHVCVFAFFYECCACLAKRL